MTEAEALIDYGELERAYQENRIYALQLEVGDFCYQNCIYCYMNALLDTRNTLNDEQIIKISRIPNPWELPR